eukprot:16271644-Heterocapsa_arctica.AAC.1
MRGRGASSRKSNEIKLPAICKECWETGKCAVCQHNFRPCESSICDPIVGWSSGPTSGPLQPDE